MMACKCPFRITVLSRSAKGSNLSSTRNPRLHHRPIRIQTPSKGQLFVLQAKSYATSAPSSRLPNDASAVLEESSQPLSIDRELQRAARILELSTARNEQDVYNALQTCENMALRLAVPIGSRSTSSRPGRGPTSNLLLMDDGAAQSVAAQAPIVASSQVKLAKKISSVAYRLMKHPNVFITPRLLTTYVETQSMLGQPQSFPHVFDLYASKPIPQPGSSPIRYKDSRPNNPSAAIPLPLAQSALNSAIQAKDLALCMSIIETTVCAPAFKRAKFIRRALLPLTALTLSPLAAYALASQYFLYSGIKDPLMDPQTMTNYAAVGFVLYIGYTATIGIVALTTANDQMDRITWISGTALWERWIREEERAFIDKVAQAWGLADRERRGSEEGPEWEGLRNWAFHRGMYLDKPELMEGME